MKTLILPSEVSNDVNSRLVSLRDPRTGSTINRYLFSPKHGLYEFTVIGSQRQSILFVQQQQQQQQKKQEKEEKEEKEEDGSDETHGEIAESAEIWIATPVDFLFFLIPILLGEPAEGGGETTRDDDNKRRLFQPLDDIIDSQQDGELFNDHLRYILYEETFRPVCLDRVESVCDVVEAGDDEKMFRFSEEKLLGELIRKAKRMILGGKLPDSLEERFVHRALLTPLMAVKREDVVVEERKGGGDGGGGNASSSSSSTTTTIASPEDRGSPATSSTSVEPDNAEAEKQTRQQNAAPESIVQLLRLSTALSFIKESYLSDSLRKKMDKMLASPQSPIDFTPLTVHLEHVAALRAEALASRSLFGGGKRNADEEDDEAEARGEKKRKKEEEEKKKKAGESKGVRNLKKVNTIGMKKMSDFFGLPASKKRKG